MITTQQSNVKVMHLYFLSYGGKSETKKPCVKFNLLGLFTCVLSLSIVVLPLLAFTSFFGGCFGICDMGYLEGDIAK